MEGELSSRQPKGTQTSRSVTSSAADTFQRSEFEDGSHDDWRTFQPEVNKKLALERMREAYRHRDEQRLEEALKEIPAKDRRSNYRKEIENAEIALQILKAARKLKRACEDRNVDSIKECIREIREEGFADDLMNEIRDAKYAIEDLTRRRPRPPVTVELSRKTMSEIRRYHKPPPDLHGVMQGVLLLLGEDEETTANWKEVQRLCMPFDQSSIYRRIVDFDANNVHGELAARSKQILRKYDAEKLRQTSPAGAMLYVWAMGVIEELEKNDKCRRPAGPSRQRELLGRTVPPAERMDRQYYQTLAKSKMINTQSNSNYRPMLPPLNRDSPSQGDRVYQYQHNEDRERKIPGLYTDYKAHSSSSSFRSDLSP